MPKFLIEAKFAPEGIKGVISEGGSARREAVRIATESAGGHLESFHFAFGEYDSYTIADLPDNESAEAVAMAASASGALRTNVVVLLTPEETDAAVRRSIDFRPPGA